nr:NAD-dependent succinate-semialdehyde dehydrogenase [uncultured Devosia sp.]
MTQPIKTQLFIAGQWCDGQDGAWLDVVNPATGSVIGAVAMAGRDDLDRAVRAADDGFRTWRKVSALDRARVLRRAGELLRERVEAIALTMTLEQGKPLAEARLEILSSADILDWFAEEGRRVYGREIPSRRPGVLQVARREPVGPVAAFTPWNFPISQVVRKLGAALASGCSVVVKAAEETPASPSELVRALADAGLPAGVVNLVYGVPSEISNYLIPHPSIRKVSFTGSVPVGKHLAALAGTHMKRATMELGGHAAAFVFADADLDKAVNTFVASKFRNAGQVCVSPTRFLVEDRVADQFAERFASRTAALKVGDGQDPASAMGPLVNERRLQAVDELIADARRHGAEVMTGGERMDNAGSFYRPTVLRGLDTSMRIMNEEPFGPVALVLPFSGIEQAVEEANRLPFGLASYAFTESARNAAYLADNVEAGMLSINHLGLGLAETPFGGIKDSGYGSEGGLEAMESYLTTKFVSHDLFP